MGGSDEMRSDGHKTRQRHVPLDNVRLKIMTTHSISHRILRTALAIAMLLQMASVSPTGACGLDGSCCTVSSACQDSGTCCSCCSLTQDGRSRAGMQSCCHVGGAESTFDSSSCCHSMGAESRRCNCSCSQPEPAPAAPPVDQETQTRLISSYAYLTDAVDVTPVTAVSTRWNTYQPSLLKTAPRSVQVLFCTWQT